jgi:sortase A
MPDRRTVDDLSIEELEEILRIRKREARLERLKRLEQTGRRPADALSPADDRGKTAVNDPARQLAYESFAAADRGRPLRERLLLMLEIAAALGLVAVLVFAVNLLRDINRESSQAQAADLADLPTPEPTPLISAVVLPGGHTPPTDPGGAQPNYDEVPAYLRPLVEQQFAGPVIVPTPSPAHAIQLQIPAIGVDAPIVQGDGWEQLKKGVGQHLGTVNPGQPGNVVLSAHDDIYGEIFRRLDRLSPGDEVIIRSQTQSFTYRVVDWRTVDPTDVSIMDQTQESIVTLISCYPYLVNTQRIVVIAELQQ